MHTLLCDCCGHVLLHCLFARSVVDRATSAAFELGGCAFIIRSTCNYAATLLRLV
jgi:hypothetical protein